MSRIPMPKASLLLVALGGALLFGHQVAPDLDAAPTVVLTVPAADVSPAASGHVFVADMNVDDAAAPAMR